MPKRSGLRTEIIVHIAFLLAAALLFVSFILIKLAEREVLEERTVSAMRFMDILAQIQNLDGNKSGQWLQTSLPYDWPAADIALLDAELQVLNLKAGGKAPRVNLSELQQVRLQQQRSVLLRYDGAWWPFDRDRERYLLISIPVLSGDRFVGALQGRFPLDDIRRSLIKGQKFVLVLISGYGLILILVGAYLLGRNVVRPVRLLARATRQVRAGYFEETIDVQGPTEIAALASDFNDMVGALRQSREAAEATIASLQKTNEELQRTQQDLIRSERLASVGHLAAGMAHEIGNPLGAVVGYLELLKADSDDPNSRDLVQRSLVELDRIDRLVRDLLDYAAPSTDEMERLDPTSVLFEAYSLLSQQGVLDEVRVQNRLPSNLPIVTVSRHKLLQVFVNLLLNARDASGKEGLIRLEGGTEGGEVWLSVTDEGCGISEEQQGSIFDPFYTTKEPGKGRGLGLAVCHRIVEEAGGRIEVISRVRLGSSLTVRLPVDAGGAA